MELPSTEINKTGACWWEENLGAFKFLLGIQVEFPDKQLNIHLEFERMSRLEINI